MAAHEEPLASGLKARSSPWTARLLAACFCLLLVSVPGTQLAGELFGRERAQLLDVFKRPPTLENLQAYERALERSAVTGKAVRPYTQLLYTGLARGGNEQVVIGSGGWLFYRPGIEHVVGRGFLQSAGDLPSGEPLSAVLLFRDSLREYGVELLLLPVPGKETIHPERLTIAARLPGEPPVNRDMRRFLAELERRGVAVFDPTPLLWEARGGEAGPLYLPHDTHWSPAGMALAARGLADHLRRAGYLDGAAPEPYRTQAAAVENRGDLFTMLDLSPRAPLLPTTRVTLQQVLEAGTGELCRPDARSPVLLLGDSFTNVFSAPELEWGEAAGLAEHLALNLGTGVDVIALNDGGVNGSRERLARAPARLEGKRVVVWQFTARDLTVRAGEWKRIRLRSPAR